MRTFFDCIPCFVRQSLESARLATSDEAVHERVLREALRTAAEMDLRRSPPAMGQHIHRVIRECTGQNDPYREMKDHFNQMALKLYPTLRQWFDDSDHPIETAVRLAIAGNVIDVAVKTQLTDAEVRESILGALSAPFEGDVDQFVSAVRAADKILYLADNVGEIVFDRLLIEQLQPANVTVAVRGFPVINDATLADAETAGIDQVAAIIDNGSDAPGTILDDCSPSFREHFDQADLVIAKGQGNYETLNEVDKDIFFLLTIKCPVIARHTGYPTGTMYLERSTASVVAGEEE
ncbi:MAG: DUF89 family protein [Pirellulales bacterium]|nr:DUF89 family protein [Pirellulales bacterium]